MSYKGNYTSASNELFATTSTSKQVVTKSNVSATAAPSGSSSSGSTAGWSKSSNSSYNYGASAAAGKGLPSSYLSEAQKSKKLAEAAEWREKAKKSMKSSFWR